MNDIIETFLKGLIGKSGENKIEIQRNELAKYFNCAPSQINYVLTTRFTIGQGYTVESQRGGGGFIKIKQVILSQTPYVYHIITTEIGDLLSQNQAEGIIKFLVERGIITKRESELMRAAINDSAISTEVGKRNELRASILKEC